MIRRGVRPSPGLGDLVRVVGALRPSDDEIAAIADVLGLRPYDGVEASSTEETPVSPVAVAAELSREPVAAAESPWPGPAPEPSSVARVRAGPLVGPGEIDLTFVGTETPTARTWISDVEEISAPDAAAGSYDATVPPFEPLLAPTFTRAVVAEAMSTRAYDGPVDIARLARDLATQRPIHELPSLPVSTLRRGAQILVDRTASMQPFQADADELAARIQEVTSQGATRLLYFDEDPAIVDDSWPVGEGRTHELPPAGTPIVLITDLGIRGLRSGRSRARRHWISFAIEASRHHCPVVAFVPYPPSRWPAGLDGLVMLVPWDRKTTIATARAARRTRSG